MCTTPYSEKILQKKVANAGKFANALRFAKMFSRKHFTLAKPHSLLSTVVPTSAIAAITEAPKKIVDNSTGPHRETLVVAS